MRRKLSIFIFVSLQLGTILHADDEKAISDDEKTIVFDLFTQQNIPLATKLALANAKKYAESRRGAAAALVGFAARSITQGKNPTTLQAQLFETLQEVPIDTSVETAYYQEMKLPPIFCAYLTSQLPRDEVLRRAIEFLDNGTCREKKLFKAVTELFLTPEQVIQTMQPSHIAIAVLKKIKEAHPEINLVLAAHFQSLDQLKRSSSFAKMLPLFDQTFCSGEVGTLKTATYFYAQLADRSGNISPRTTLFVESELKHAQGAARAGFSALAWNGKDGDAIERALVKKEYL